MSESKPNNAPGQPINVTVVKAEAMKWWYKSKAKTAGMELGALHRLLKDTATSGYMRGFIAGVESCQPKPDKANE